MIVCGSAAWLQARAVGLGNAMEGCCDRVASSILRHVPCPLSVPSCHVERAGYLKTQEYDGSGLGYESQVLLN